MTSLFTFREEELLAFFMVLVRFSVFFAVLPIIGENRVPGPLKILMGVVTSLMMFPMLVSQGLIDPAQAKVWGSNAPSLIATAALEALYALVIGFVAKMVFDAITFGGNLIGNFMGFAMASTYDPMQETQTQVVAEIHMALAVLVFLAVDGHHLMFKTALESYSTVGIGGIGQVLRGGMTQAFADQLIGITGKVIVFGVQLAAPIALALFGVNVAFGVMAKAMPQLNVLVLSFSVTATIGLFVMLLSVPEFTTVSSQVTGMMPTWMNSVSRAIGGQ